MLSLGEFECSDVAGWALRPGDAALIGGRAAVGAGTATVDGGAAGLQRLGLGWPAVAGELGQQWVGDGQVGGLREPAGGAAVEVESERFLDAALEEQRNGEWRYLEFLQVTSLITAGIFVRELPGGTRAGHRPRPVDTCPKTDTDHSDQSVPVLFAPLFLEGRFIRRLFRGG